MYIHVHMLQCQLIPINYEHTCTQIISQRYYSTYGTATPLFTDLHTFNQTLGTLPAHTVISAAFNTTNA